MKNTELNQDYFVVLYAKQGFDNLICFGVYFTQERAEKVKKGLLTRPNVEFVSIYKGVKL